ncbi:Armadillo-type_fold [Hexamita inflata]|uniref:Armadillo-type fold n=1 Tax=Hexamita inflata TaxID=28002 RepID=A0AA86N6G2_9EUKA|nr:Armadillo-type fold [Hexamita inflata]
MNRTVYLSQMLGRIYNTSSTPKQLQNQQQSQPSSDLINQIFEMYKTNRIAALQKIKQFLVHFDRQKLLNLIWCDLNQFLPEYFDVLFYIFDSDDFKNAFVSQNTVLGEEGTTLQLGASFSQQCVWRIVLVTNQSAFSFLRFALSNIKSCAELFLLIQIICALDINGTRSLVLNAGVLEFIIDNCTYFDEIQWLYAQDLILCITNSTNTSIRNKKELIKCLVPDFVQFLFKTDFDQIIVVETFQLIKSTDKNLIQCLTTYYSLNMNEWLKQYLIDNEFINIIVNQLQFQTEQTARNCLEIFKALAHEQEALIQLEDNKDNIIKLFTHSRLIEWDEFEVTVGW